MECVLRILWSFYPILHVLLYSNLPTFTYATDPTYCSYCDTWTSVEDLQDYNVYSPLNSLTTASYPVIIGLVSYGGVGEAIIIGCTNSQCSNTYTKFIQADSFAQVVSTSTINGDYVIGAMDFSGVTRLYDCQNQACENADSSSVSWHIADTICVATTIDSKNPVLFGAFSSSHQIEFNICQDPLCSGTHYIFVNVSTLLSTATNSSFAIDGHSNYVVLVQQSSSATDLIFVFCHDQGTNCSQSILRKTAGISQFSVVSPPSSAFYVDGQSYAVLQVCQSSSPVSVTFCLSDYCIQNTTTTFGISPSAAAIAYGSDNLPVITYIDSGIIYVTHCFDYICGTYMQPHKIGTSNTFVTVTAVSNGQFILIAALDNVDTLWTALFCGPFVTSYSPETAVVNESTAVTFNGYFCSASASTCKYGLVTSTSTINSPTQLLCTVSSSTAEEGPISVGNSGWTEYASAGNFTFYGPSPSPTPSVSVTPTASASPVPSTSPVASPTASVTPSVSTIPTASRTPSVLPKSPSPSPTASLTASGTPSITPSGSVSTSSSPTITPPSSSPSASPVVSGTPLISATPSMSSSTTPSGSMTPSASTSPDSGGESSDDTDNTQMAITMLSIVLTSFFAAAIITTYAYFRWSTAKRYRPAAVSLSWDNFVTLVAIPLDFFQFCAFSTNIKAEWARVIYNASKGTILEIPNTAYLALYWIVLISTAFWCLYTAPFFIRFNWKGNRTPLVDWLRQRNIFKNESLTLKAMYYPASLVMIPFGSVLFFAISNVLLQMISCKYWAGADPVLNMDNNIQCWTGVHTFLSILTLLVFFAYFPMAIHLMPKLQQVSVNLDIKYNEKFLFISSILKLLICVVHALFAEWEVPRLMTVCAVTLILTIVNMEMEPCNIHRLNSIRSAIYFAACCCAICSVGATFTAKSNIVPLVILMLCWAIIAILLILAQLGVVHRFIERRNGQLLRALHETETNEEPEHYIRFNG